MAMAQFALASKRGMPQQNALQEPISPYLIWRLPKGARPWFCWYNGKRGKEDKPMKLASGYKAFWEAAHKNYPDQTKPGGNLDWANCDKQRCEC
ncbi:hypothetical protein LCM4576_22390 [Mesorhizobium sp. LCM 4576]|nr:hypothetical protein LCM4576_22390 [Mesorhizobium sp. LCM 4576]